MRNDGRPLRASEAVKMGTSVAFQPKSESTEQNAPWAAVPFARLVPFSSGDVDVHTHLAQGHGSEGPRERQWGGSKGRAEKEGTSSSNGMSPTRRAGRVS